MLAPALDSANQAPPGGNAEDAVPDVEALLGELRSRVQERRASGAYPPGLEHDLDVHFRHIVAHRPVRDLEALKDAMKIFERNLTFDPASIPVGSQAPGGELLHRSISRLMVRQTGWLAEQLQGFAESVRVILWKMIESMDSPTHVHADLTAQIDTLLDRLAHYEQVPMDVNVLASILQRLDTLEAAQRSADPPDSSSPTQAPRAPQAKPAGLPAGDATG